ncbi:hypothetical protein [Pelagibacterium luteolum]|uniref:Uncharacterized protein n=1 Tax=Pelagibacterium luteolum TaxID=440168 RepID=A0A1G7SA00_9HYPH|nr:hypothetical protein [Pelagibacterium luteolum]SDG19866.1 hypothetical protein SAMN04487974_101389 [Pelagibacterium luteolum]
MKTTGLMLGGAALALALSLGTPAFAQDIDFGDDSSTFANDGQCDDPRFEGVGAALILSPVDESRDATDCQTAFDAGDITLIAPADEDADDTAEASITEPLPTSDIDFGDDSGSFANDGECDDPRFGGALASHELADATDCRTAYDAGDVTYAAPTDDVVAATPAGEIDFGDDSGTFANDGECDDPRFGGALTNHERADATDCQTAYDAGDVTYSGDTSVDTPMISSDDIDFGDDSGNWANDGECDDPRFGGGLTSHELADATDCREAYEAGEVTYQSPSDDAATPVGDIDFGDDSGVWANDGECDDPRFGGGLTSHELTDATDCREAYEAGEVTFTEGTTGPTGDPIVIDGIDFGDDTGNWANDGECDDPRFTGAGVGVALDDHLMADATDCSTAYAAGTVTLAEDTDTPSSEFRINFGDDSGATANDGVCDDPRFQGRGGALELLEANVLSDATDCRAAYDAGTVTYNP